MLISFVCALFSFGQNIKFENIGLDEGLSQASCLAICKDFYGFYWIGTEDGLNQFSGESLKVYKKSDLRNSISNNYISILHPYKEDFVLIGNKTGLDIYDHRKDLITKNILNVGVITDIVTYGDSLLLSNEDGNIYVFYQDNGEFTKKPLRKISSPVTCLAYEKKNSDLFIGTVKGALKLSLITKQIERIFFKGYASSDITVKDLELYKNELFIATGPQGLFRYSSFINPAVTVGLNDKSISKLINYDNKLWYGGASVLGQLKIGINKDIKRRTFNFNKGGFIITSFLVTKGGDFSYGTYGEGFYILKKDQFNHIATTETSKLGFQSKSIWGFRKGEGDTILVNGDKGIEKIVPFKSERIFKGRLAGVETENYDIQDYLETDKCYWLATSRSGLVRIDKETATTIEYRKTTNDYLKKICSDRLRRLFLDSKNRLWIGAFGEGFSIMNLESGKISNFPNSGKKNLPSYIFSYYENNLGDVFISSYKGLIKYNNSIFKKYPILIDNEPVQFIYDINSIGNEKAWISSNQGVFLYDFKLKKVSKHYSVRTGLKDDHIYGSVIDKNNDLWISSNYGLAKIDVKHDKISTFDEKDGLQSREFNGTAFGEFNELLFFGGVNGMNYFHPDSVLYEKEIKDIYLSNFQVNFEPFYIQDSLSRSQINFTKSIDLNYKESTISLEFISPGDNGDVVYEYRLVGFDKDWIKTKTNKGILYRNLPPGVYRLEIRGQNVKSLIYSKVKNLNIRISSPYWRKPVFWLIALIIVTLTIFLLVTNKISREKKAKKMLKDKVEEQTYELKKALEDKEVLFQEVHHRVKNNLQLISSLLNLQSYSVFDAKALEAFEKSKDRIRSMALVHTKLYQNKETEHLGMKDYLNDLYLDISRSFQRDSSKVDYSIKVSDDIVLSVGTSVKFGLIVTEIVINAFKYGLSKKDSPKISIELSQNNNTYNLTISDNGPGFPIEEEEGDELDSLGTEIIEALVEQLNGSIKTFNDNGAIVQIYFEDISK